tara:strand:- start:291 stop:2261 length:1971 start_codon:yes stop_codon:yes gene_type:complete
MAHITLAGTLRDPNGVAAVGDKIRFTHNSTTGETVRGAVSILTIDPSGVYSIDLEYGLVLVEYKDSRDSNFQNRGVATVNATNPATSIPELLNAVVPVSSAELIEFQAILADCVTAKNSAETAAATTVQFTTNAGAGLVKTTDSRSVQQLLDIAPNTLGNQIDGSPAYEDFDRPENFVVSGMTTKSGDPFTINGPGSATAFIKDNALTNEGGGNFYMTPGTSPTLLTEVWGAVSFIAVGAGDAGVGPQAVIMFTDDGPTGLDGGLIHLEVTPLGSSLKTTVTGAGNLLPYAGTATILNGGAFHRGVELDGTQHRIGLKYVRKATAAEDELYIYLPLGQITKFVGDVKVRQIMDASYWGVGQIQTPTSATDGEQPRWHGIGYGRRRSNTPSVLSGAASVETQLRNLGKMGGLKLDNLKKRIRINPTGVGWYTVATQVSPSTAMNAIGGEFTFSGINNAGRLSKGRVVFGWETLKGLNIESVEYPIGFWSGNTMLDAFRVSQDTTGNDSFQLDVYINDFGNLIGDAVVIDLDGYFTAVESPVVGATPLSSKSHERKLDFNKGFADNITGNATRTATPGISSHELYLPDHTAPSQRLILDNSVALASDTFHFVRPSTAANGWILENSSDSVAFHSVGSGTWCDVAMRSGKFIVVRSGTL